MSRDVLKQNQSAGVEPPRICTRHKESRYWGEGRRKQIIRQLATSEKPENPHQLRSGFLETVGGKKTVVY